MTQPKEMTPHEALAAWVKFADLFDQLVNNLDGYLPAIDGKPAIDNGTGDDGEDDNDRKTVLAAMKDARAAADFVAGRYARYAFNSQPQPAQQPVHQPAQYTYPQQ
ncbi:hypothetical protein [Amycolatopsis sp. DSM 110486]|uniref:hypothetical protein n=1 Tax=Amycolatopsis sp. DSM 110486 TaxID=2865832 RepID=UPI001C6966A3|nr:hypothetical protein [Amycolatopsis sp. DSM 110486]QYN17472.1 hypothetical protein K1T34_32315 [Amycolatopsis sp. DSM 110486]